jgi:nitrite reductase/ring-hydroxylating ferredoxin subunit
MQPVCSVAEVPTDGCLAVANGEVLLAQVDGTVVAYHNRCLHTGLPLADGLVRDGELTCPGHFWRYRLADGRRVNGTRRGALEPVPCEVVDGVVHVGSAAAAPTSIRELLRDHARTWQRDR